MQEGYRPLTANERAILQRLMEIDFAGRAEAAAQIDHLTARPAAGCAEHCGSLDLVVDLAAPTIAHTNEFERKLDTEGWAVDEDDIPVEILLFHKQGRLSFLEFVVYSDRLKRQPNAADIEVVSLAKPQDRESTET